MEWLCHHNINVIGPAGSGKTIIIKKIARKLLKSGIVNEIHVFSPFYGDNTWGKSVIKHTNVDDIVDLCANETGRKLIIFDDFGIYVKDSQALLELLTKSRSHNNRIIISCQPAEKKSYPQSVRKSCSCKIVLR